MALINISDEVTPSRTATVFSNKALKTVNAFTAYSVPSASGTAVIAAAACILHSVTFQTTSTAGANFWLFNCAATAGAIGNTASAVARFDDGHGRESYIFDAILGSGLTYRLSGTEGTSGITITYALATA